MTVARAGHGVSTTARTSSPAARATRRQQRVVDRAEARAGGDHERQRRARSRGRRRVKLLGERRQQAADALDDQPRPCAHRRAARAAAISCSGVDRIAGQLGGEVRRDGGAVAQRRDLLGLPCSATLGEQLVVGGPGSARGDFGGIVEPGHDRLVGAHRLALRRAPPRAARRSATVLPTPVSVAVTNSPRTPRLVAQAARSKSNGARAARAGSALGAYAPAPAGG